MLSLSRKTTLQCQFFPIDLKFWSSSLCRSIQNHLGRVFKTTSAWPCFQGFWFNRSGAGVSGDFTVCPGSETPCLNLLAFVRGGLRDLANMTFHRPFTVRSHLIEFIMMGHGLVTLASYLLSLVNSGLQCPELPARLLFWEKITMKIHTFCIVSSCCCVWCFFFFFF